MQFNPTFNLRKTPLDCPAVPLKRKWGKCIMNLIEEPIATREKPQSIPEATEPTRFPMHAPEL